MKLFKWFKQSEKPDYICAECGKIHAGWPALAFDSPTAYYELSEREKLEIATIDSDFCIIKHSEQTDRFIRVTLIQKVLDAPEDLDYGLWVSLSQKSFQDYKDNYNNKRHEASYFGWLCNLMPPYENTLSIPTTVFTQKGNKRPQIFPHQDYDHEFVRDFYNGISAHEAQRRVDEMGNA